jgi:hypothetical protein
MASSTLPVGGERGGAPVIVVSGMSWMVVMGLSVDVRVE